MVQAYVLASCRQSKCAKYDAGVAHTPAHTWGRVWAMNASTETKPTVPLVPSGPQGAESTGQLWGRKHRVTLLLPPDYYERFKKLRADHNLSQGLLLEALMDHYEGRPNALDQRKGQPAGRREEFPFFDVEDDDEPMSA